MMSNRRPILVLASALTFLGCSSSNSSPPGTSAAACAASTPAALDMTMFGRAEGLVVAPDGTIYFSDFDAHVMRYAPPYASGLERTWATVDKGWIFGIMLDPKRKVIYAGSRATRPTNVPDGGAPAAPAVYKIDITDPTKVTKFADAEPGINGLTMGDDGSLYYSDQTGGHIYRVTPEGTKTQVTKTPVDNADGIAFGPDKKLYVIPYLEMACPITRLTLDASHTETARDVFIDLGPNGGKHGDGIAFDKDGNVYLTAQGLFKVTPDKKVTMLSAIGGANIEFGVGALACTDLLWATNNKTDPPQHLKNDIVGQDVYWHRP
jgi:sugar lactone lactonase YvrE